MPGQGRATAEAEYIEDHFVVIPSMDFISHLCNRKLYPVMPTFGPYAQTQTHQILRGLKAIRSVLAVNGAWSIHVDSSIVAAKAIVTVQIIQLRHIRHIAVRQDLVIARWLPVPSKNTPRRR